jgi:FkbM family methyltransferase
MEIEYYSQYQQDKYLDETVFKKKENGFFLDIGAHDGVSLNNTYFFEKYRNWNGICIEPIPEVFDKLDKNRHCIKIRGCISEQNGKASFLRLKGYTEMLSGLVNGYDPRHVERIKRELYQFGGEAQEIMVECFNINDLLSKYNISHIDYCSIDVEGLELSILKSINFKTVHIDLFTVENNYGTADLRNFMDSQGYDFIAYLGCDDIFKSRKNYT